MKAIKSVEKGKAEIQEVPKPKLRDDYVCRHFLAEWVGRTRTDMVCCRSSSK